MNRKRTLQSETQNTQMAQQHEVSPALSPNTPLVDAFPLAPPVSPTELSEADRTSAALSRRTFCNIVGGIAIGLATPPMAAYGALAFDQSVSRVLQSHDTEAQLIDDSNWRQFRRTVLLVLPGFNVFGGEKIAAAIAPSVINFAQVASMHYGNKAFDPGAIKEHAVNFMEDEGFEEAYIYGHSMGGTFGIELASYLHERGVTVSGIFADCSPTDQRDLKQVDQTEFDVLRAANYASMYGGIATRYAIEVGVNLKQNNQSSFDALRNARRVLSTEVCSTTIAAQQASYLYFYDVADTLEDLPRNIPLAYLGPSDARRDRVVNNDTAFNRLLRVRQSGPYTRRFRLPDIGHASVQADADVYSRNILFIYRDFMSRYARSPR